MKQNRIAVLAVTFAAIILSSSAIDYCTGYLGMTTDRVNALIGVITA